MKAINVVSVFDGMSCGQIALDELGIKVNNYFASEIDEKAIKVTMANYPNTIQLGDITKINGSEFSNIDLLIGGSPCQGFSFAGHQLNFDDPRSALFFEYVRLMKELKPTYFLLENVGMSKKSEAVITKYMGVEPITINSDVFTPQLRKRLYWTNIPQTWNERTKKFAEKYKYRFKLNDILESGNVDRDKAYCIDANYGKGSNLKAYYEKSRRQIVFVGKGEGKHEVKDGKDYYYRLLTPTEVERLQGVPEGYTDHVAKIHRYHMLGNGWTIPVIKYLFKDLKF